MVLKYRLLEKGEPGVADGGTKKWYACVITDAEVSIDGLVKSIEKFSALSEADIRGGDYCLGKHDTSYFGRQQKRF